MVRELVTSSTLSARKDTFVKVSNCIQLYALFLAGTHIQISFVCMQDTFQLYAFALTLQLLNLITFAWRASVAYPQDPRAWVNKLLDTLTYSAPASIPTIFLVLTYIARMRLDKAGISLLYSQALHVGAYVNMVCFDKTGTLTDSVVSLFFLLLHVGAYVNMVCFDKTGTLTDSMVSLFFLLLHVSACVLHCVSPVLLL